jgi:hypothetical protein
VAEHLYKQSQGPGFNPQYHKKKKKENSPAINQKNKAKKLSYDVEYSDWGFFLLFGPF